MTSIPYPPLHGHHSRHIGQPGPKTTWLDLVGSHPAAAKPDFRHSGDSAFDVDAAFMLLEVHGSGIHAL